MLVYGWCCGCRGKVTAARGSTEQGGGFGQTCGLGESAFVAPVHTCLVTTCVDHLLANTGALHRSTCRHFAIGAKELCYAQGSMRCGLY